MNERGVMKIVGAREHNLKSVSLTIPKEQLVVITGPSGSGKSSLALDTLYAEGQRRYVESLAAYARQFLGVSKKPDVDKIEGLCPAIAIEQKTVGYNPRSTVGTITEIYDYLRVLFARTGTAHCSSCRQKISAESPESIMRMVMTRFSGMAVTIASPIGIEKKGEFKHEMKELYSAGWQRFLIDGTLHRFRSEGDIDSLSIRKSYKHTIYLLIDTLTIQAEDAVRVQEAIEKSFAIKAGVCTIIDSEGQAQHFSAERVCMQCLISSPELEPRLFSFNSPLGACTSCNGLGTDLYAYQEIWMSMMQEEEGNLLRERYDGIECGACRGSRLNDQVLSVTIMGKNIYEFCLMSVNELRDFCLHEIRFGDDRDQIAASLLKEIVSRLTFLINVGLDYISLARSARTLSGGEGQRIRLATQIGSSLAGVLYILDEPSIGLHQRDNDRLIATLQHLRDQGNTVVVVEHDMDTIRAADYVIDMGPGAGILGGEVTAVGTPAELIHNPKSLTGQYLSGKREIKIPTQRRPVKEYLTIKGARANNLKQITVNIPLGIFVAVSGVSGSGKSSLIMQTLARELVSYFQRGYLVCQECDEIEGIDKISNVVMVDQTPIGRTPRSNPATYLGIFNEIRSLYASLPESNARGYKVGRFSFNVADGRCRTCSGEGKIKVSMHFLEDVFVECRACKGKRYNSQTLEITYRGKNIYDILNLSVYEAVSFFEHFPRLHKRLKLMCDVGLDYITLGQSSMTLSGGEAQRIKLVHELAKRDRKTLYILDEPTTGLHSSDIEKLLQVIDALVERGNTVLVIEHNLDVLKSVDYLIDIGPDGGLRGGEVVVAGTPEVVAATGGSVTGYYLAQVLNARTKKKNV